MLFLGVDLAWGEGRDLNPPNESGVVCLDAAGTVLDAGWTRGLTETCDWIRQWSGPDCLLAVDAPLVVTNGSGQRTCERQVGQRYGRWRVSANTTNTRSPRLAGVALLNTLVACGWRYHDGHAGPPRAGLHAFECYPYTTLVGTPELGYHADERPRYKRKPKGMPTAEWRPLRALACDELIRRVDALQHADPPLELASHPVTASLRTTPSPLRDAPYKHAEDLIDGLLCAWTASLWRRHGRKRVQVLGDPPGQPGRSATILAPAVAAQRRP